MQWSERVGTDQYLIQESTREKDSAKQQQNTCLMECESRVLAHVWHTLIPCDPYDRSHLDID